MCRLVSESVSATVSGQQQSNAKQRNAESLGSLESLDSTDDAIARHAQSHTGTSNTHSHTYRPVHIRTQSHSHIYLPTSTSTSFYTYTPRTGTRTFHLPSRLRPVFHLYLEPLRTTSTHPRSYLTIKIAAIFPTTYLITGRSGLLVQPTPAHSIPKSGEIPSDIRTASR